jgi:hypothetical protein
MNTISLNPTRTAREQRFENEQELFKASGLTVREFCRRHNISPSGFYSRRANSADVGARAPLVAPPELPSTAGFIDAGVLKKSKTKKSGWRKSPCADSRGINSISRFNHSLNHWPNSLNTYGT